MSPSPLSWRFLDLSDASAESDDREDASRTESPDFRKSGSAKHIFNEVVNLDVGEALLFAPSALLGLDSVDKKGLQKLGTGYLKLRIRQKLTEDGGKSVMAS